MIEEGVIKGVYGSEKLYFWDHGRKPYATNIFLNFRQVVTRTKDAIRAYDIRTPSHETPVKSLSGGNIQKLCWRAGTIAQSENLNCTAQPTRRVDIGATEYIHKRLLEERDKARRFCSFPSLDEIRATL